MLNLAAETRDRGKMSYNRRALYTTLGPDIIAVFGDRDDGMIYI